MVNVVSFRLIAAHAGGCLLLSLAFASASLADSTAPGVPRADAGRWEVALVPPEQAGWIGWCSEVVDADSSGGSCPVQPMMGERLIDEGWSASGPPQTVKGFVITSVEATSVTVPGAPPIPTISQPRLPFGLRAATVEIPGAQLFEGFPLRSFTVIGESGQALPDPRAELGSLSVQTKFWKRPQTPPPGICQLSTRHAGLIAARGNVALEAAGQKGILGQGFLSCIDTEYSFGHSFLHATLLLNGASPGSRPAPLPNMKPLADHRDVVVEGGVVARRRGNAWLLVRGGRGVAQRVQVLDALRPSTSLASMHH
jgi:hypothetical protein